MNYDTKFKRIALCDRSMWTGVFCLTVNTCEKVQKYLRKIFRGSSNCFLWQATDVGFATFLRSWLVHGAALCGRKSGGKFEKQVEGANLRASVTRCRWEDASTAELRVGAACSFFLQPFFGFSRVLHLSACHTQATSIAGRDLVPIIELHDGKYIAIHSDLSRQEWL